MSGKRPSLADSLRQVGNAPAEPLPAPMPAPVPASPPKTAKAAKEAERPTGFYAATRVGKKKITASVNPAVHTQLKILAVRRGTTTEALLSEAITDLLTKLDPTGAK